MTYSDAYKPTISLCCSALAHIFSQHGISPFSCAYNTPTPARSKEHSEFPRQGQLVQIQGQKLWKVYVCTLKNYPFWAHFLSNRSCPSQNRVCPTGAALLKTCFVQQELPFSKYVLSSRNYTSQSMFSPTDRSNWNRTLNQRFCFVMLPGFYILFFSSCELHDLSLISGTGCMQWQSVVAHRHESCMLHHQSVQVGQLWHLMELSTVACHWP